MSIQHVVVLVALAWVVLALSVGITLGVLIRRLKLYTPEPTALRRRSRTRRAA